MIKYNDQLLLFGFSSGEDDANLMDVFALQDPLSDRPVLTKIYTRNFPKTELTRFGWGAGVHYENGKFTLYACSENILDQFIVMRYPSL